MIANLMMYRRPQLDVAHDHLWDLIRENLKRVGIDSPRALSQDAEAFAVWRDPALVLSQTCGMPYRTWLHDMVQLVGTPDYGLEGCAAGYYRSALVVRADDSRSALSEFREAVFAYNDTFSQSGYAAPFWHARQLGFWFERSHHTGAHLSSARAVAQGHADIAAIDAVTWRNVMAFEAFAPDLRVLEWTAPTPGLPLITAAGQDADAIFGAVRQAIEELDARSCAQLGLRGIVRISKAAYLAVQNPD